MYLWRVKIGEYIPFYKRNLNLAMPVVLSQIGQVLVTLVDNIMVGHAGTVDLAASAFANNVFLIGMFFGMGVTYGLTPMVGKAYGNNRMNEVVLWLKNGMSIHFIAAIILTLIMFGVWFFLPLMGQTESVTELAKPYYLLLCFSYLPFMMFFSLKQFFEGVGNTKMAMQITLMANAINVVLNYVLIFGKLGFPAYGLVGAGIGTLISRIFMPLMFMVFILRYARFKRFFVLARLQVIEKVRMLALLKIGVPIGFQIIVEVITFSIGAVMMGWLGETELAAHQVAIGLAGFTYMISLGISQATTIRISHQLGKHNFESLRMAAMASTHLVLTFMTVMGLVFVFGRDLLPVLFTEDREVIALASNLLIVAAIFQVFDGLQVIMLSTLRGMADVKIPMMMAFIAYLFIGVPTSYVLTFNLNAGPAGIWYGYLAGLGSAGIMFYFKFKRNLARLN